MEIPDGGVHQFLACHWRRWLVYIGSADHYLYVLKSDGTLKWKFQTGSGVYTSPAIANDGTVYVGSLDNYLYAVRPDGTLKWKYQTGAQITLSSPAIDADGTFISGIMGAISMP